MILHFIPGMSNELVADRLTFSFLRAVGVASWLAALGEWLAAE